jgi:hypothetical protein
MGESFFPFDGWSAYFTSRPVLKGMNTNAHAALQTAETLYAMHQAVHHSKATARISGNSNNGNNGVLSSSEMWGLLEDARRHAGIVQHHDAITGTFCAYKEGCAGTDQVVGPHDVLGDYESMLQNAIDNSNMVTSSILTANTQATLGVNLTTDAGTFGKILMGNGDGGDEALLVLHNPLAVERTEAISVQVPVCNLVVTDKDTGAPVKSQVTAMFGISDGQAPYYDFSLELVTTIPPLGQKVFVVSPAPDAGCHGGDRDGNFIQHSRIHPRVDDADAPADEEALIAEAIEVQMRRTGGAGFGDPESWMETLKQVAVARRNKTNVEGRPSTDVVLENDFLKVVVDPTQGIQTVMDKATGKQYQLNHDYAVYDTVPPGSAGDAYVWKPADEAQYLLRDDQGPPLNCTAADGWRQTANCDPHGSHDGQPNEPCNYEVSWKQSGFCSCGNGASFKGYTGCDSSKKRGNFTCSEVCAKSGAKKVTTEAATVAIGPVMQEIRLQVANQHKTRIRLWNTKDPTLGYRIEIGHRIGVLEERTDLVSRFYVRELNDTSKAMLYSEDNGYELVPHPSGSLFDGSGNKNPVTTIPDVTYPSQMSAILKDDETQLSVVLERSHGVASLYPGTLDVMQHRRGEPFKGTGGTVVLDDTDRIFTETWVNVGNKTAANRMRIAMKMQLNHPVSLLFGYAKGSKNRSSISPAVAVSALPDGLYLQWARMTGENSRELMLRLQHLYAKGEDPSMSVPRTVDVAQFLASAGLQAKNITEVTLTGLLPKSELKRQHFPAESPASTTAPAKVVHESAGTVVQPYELRTFLVTF